MREPQPKCHSCGHPHLFGDECNADIQAPGWKPPYYPCHCTRGTSRKHLGPPRPPRRLAIPKAVRDAVILRDGFVCTLCGCDVYVGADAKDRPKQLLTFDHIRHYSTGGPDTIANLRVACRSCNSRRGAGEIDPRQVVRGG